MVSVTSGDGVEGDITLSVGLSADGTVTGIAFTELNETPGMGSLCGEPAFKDQFLGVKTDWFVLSGSGTVVEGTSETTGTADSGQSIPITTGSTAAIDGVTGATKSSRAVVNAINAALDFFRTYKKGGM